MKPYSVRFAFVLGLLGSGVLAAPREDGGTLRPGGISPTESRRFLNTIGTDGLRLWLRADSGVIRNKSGKVTRWSDLSGNGNDASQTEGDLKPLFVDQSINGRPAIRFNHTYLQTGSLAVRGGSPFTVFCVLTCGRLPKNAAAPFWNGGSDGYVLGRLDAGGAEFSGWPSSSMIGGDTMRPGQPRIMSSVYTGSRHTLYASGGFIGRRDFNASDFMSGTVTIGKAGGTPRMLLPFQGDIAEIIVYEHPLTDAERNLIEGYLERKYAIPHGYFGPMFYISSFSRTVDFGRVFLRAGRTLTMNVYNSGGISLAIDSVHSDHPRFAVNVAHDTLRAGASRYYPVTYTPLVARSDTGHIIFFHSGETSPDTALVSGTGDSLWLRLSSPDIDLGETFVGSAQSFTVNLTSTLPATEKFTCAVPDTQQFGYSVMSDSLSPFERFHYRIVSFHPKAAGVWSGEVIFRPLDPLSPETLRIRGIGIAPFSESRTSTSWQWLNPFPQGNDLYGTSLLDPSTIIAVGNAGTLLKSVDGGSHWRVRSYLNGNAGQYGVAHALTDRILIIAGNGSILRSTDAGESWNTAGASPFNGSYSLRDRISFGNAMVGTASVGGSILRTTDAGQTWKTPGQGGPLFWDKVILDVATVGSDTVLIAASNFPYFDNSVILRSVDGGISWRDTLSLPLELPRTVSFAGRSFGVAFGTRSFYKTRTAGASWESRPFPPGLGFFPTVDAAILDSLNYVLASGSGGRIARTTDGGSSWSTVVADSNASFTSMAFLGRLDGIVVGTSGKIFRTTDGGSSWKSLVSGSTAGLTAASFIDATTGFAVGYAPVFPGGTSLLRTENSGLQWAETKLPGFNNPRAVHFQDATTGIVVDVLGAINRTTNGGESWTTSYPAAVSGYYALSFIDPLKGALCGHESGSARILVTEDGGMTWSSRLSGTTGFPFDVAVIDSATIVSVGSTLSNEAFILRSTDKGLSWTSIPIPGVSELSKVSFSDAQTGMAVGTGAASTPVLARTTNGGLTWSIRTMPAQLQGISVFDRNRAFALGFGGRFIYKTEDGGISWESEPTPTTNYFTTLQAVHTPSGGGVIYAFGYGGSIISNAVSPLSPRAWTGNVDSNWNEDGNWKPAGVPTGFDSVIIGPALNRPVIFHGQDQVVIASLLIGSGGHLTVTDSLTQFVVKGDVAISGTMEVDSGAQTNIIVGGSWMITPGGLALAKRTTTLDRGFVAARSTIFYTGNGTFRDNGGTPIHNVVFDTLASMASGSNLSIDNQCVLKSSFGLRSSDSVFILAADPGSLTGSGKFVRGTIERSISHTSPGRYRFESESTYVQFAPAGTLPSSVTMTAFPDTGPTAFGTQWVEVPSHADAGTNTVVADSITHFTKWALAVPRPTASFSRTSAGPGFLDAVRRIYDIHAEGGSNYRLRLALHYEQSEVPPGIDESSLKLYYLASAAAFARDGQGSGLPGRFALAQNYPNPFNPVTTIRYDLPVDSRVRIELFNVLGQLVKTLLDADEPAGYKMIEWNSAGMPSGVYFYRIRASSLDRNGGSFENVKKMLLIK